MFKDSYGESSGEDMLLSLQKIAEEYNSQKNMQAIAVNVTTEQKLIVAICTPLMQRVHTMHKYSGELCFMDASSNMDRHGCSVFLIMTHSSVGGLPVGVLITTSEAESTITAALELYKSLLPADCFGGKGTHGPRVFMTDDCLAERRAIRKAFSATTPVLCVFHVLQATWRWLWNTTHKVPKEQRAHHLHHMKQMVYAESKEEVQSCYDSSMADPTLHK